MNKHYTTNLLIFLFLFLVTNSLYAGNTCASATPLPNNMTAFQNVGTIGNTPSGVAAPSCGNFSASTDIWFSTTVPASGELDIVTLAGSMIDGAMAIYTGSCANLNEVQCASSDNCGSGTQMPIMQLQGLPPLSLIHISEPTRPY